MAVVNNSINAPIPFQVSNGGQGSATLTAHAVLVGEGTSAVTQLTVGSNGQVLVGSTGADPSFATLSGTGGITFTTGAGSLAINSTATGFTWSVVSGSTQAMVSGNAYSANNSGTVTFTLPVTAAIGDAYLVTGQNNATGWTVAQNAGQQIFFGTSSTTSGAGGSLASTNIYDVVEIVCIGTNSKFQTIWALGNITVV